LINTKDLEENLDGRIYLKEKRRRNPQKSTQMEESWIRAIQSEANKSFKQMGYKAKERQIWKQFTTTLCPRKGIYYYYYYFSDHVIFGFFLDFFWTAANVIK
jgi:hypothetical protein